MWNFLKTVELKKKMVNPCNYMDKDEAWKNFIYLKNNV
jgi:hypothetical protein